MVRIGVDIRVRRGRFRQIADTILSTFGAQARNNFADFRPIVEQAVSAAIIDNQEQFIPSDAQAFELGVGAGGRIDTERTRGAWRQLLPRGPNSVLTFSVRRSRRSNEIGTITVTYDEEAFLDAPLSNVPTPDAAIRSIPWMRWLIRGAPTNQQFEFDEDIATGAFSRTGGGIMIRGGIWRFPPAKPSAFRIINEEIESRVIESIERTAAEVL